MNVVIKHFTLVFILISKISGLLVISGLLFKQTNQDILIDNNSRKILTVDVTRMGLFYLQFHSVLVNEYYSLLHLGKRPSILLSFSLSLVLKIALILEKTCPHI